MSILLILDVKNRVAITRPIATAIVRLTVMVITATIVITNTLFVISIRRAGSVAIFLKRLTVQLSNKEKPTAITMAAKTTVGTLPTKDPST